MTLGTGSSRIRNFSKLAGLDWLAPDYSTLHRRQKHIDISISYQKSHGGLHLLIDRTGLKFLGEGEWKRRKHQAEYRRQWRKLHIGIDAETLQIRAVQLTANNISDSQVLAICLIKFHRLNELIQFIQMELDTKHCRQVIADRKVNAVIRATKECKTVERFEDKFNRTIWKKWSGYHR